jgi:hypothetical protein
MKTKVRSAQKYRVHSTQCADRDTYRHLELDSQILKKNCLFLSSLKKVVVFWIFSAYCALSTYELCTYALLTLSAPLPLTP